MADGRMRNGGQMAEWRPNGGMAAKWGNGRMAVKATRMAGMSTYLLFYGTHQQRHRRRHRHLLIFYSIDEIEDVSKYAVPHTGKRHNTPQAEIDAFQNINMK